MRAERLSLEDLIQRFTVLQPPPNRLTLYAWREALGLSPEEARTSQEHAFWFFTEVQRFWDWPTRRHRGINSWLLKDRKEADPVTEDMREACRTWLGQHAQKVEGEILPGQGFSQVYALGSPETGGCRVWERGEDRLFVDDDRSGWAYALSPMTPEDWKEFRAGVEVDDQYALLCDLVQVLNVLAGPDLPEEDRLTQEDVDPGEGPYPPLPEYLKTLREAEEPFEILSLPKVELFLDTLQGLAWEDLAEALALARQRLSQRGLSL